MSKYFINIINGHEFINIQLFSGNAKPFVNNITHCHY